MLLKAFSSIALGVFAALALFSVIYLSEPVNVEKAEALATPAIRIQADEQAAEPMLYLTVSSASLATATAIFLALFLRMRRTS